MYNYTFWRNNEKLRVDGPPRGASRNSTGINNIDDAIRRLIDQRVDDTFADRPDDVSGASRAEHYIQIRQSGNQCCRGEDRLQVSRYSITKIRLETLLIRSLDITTPATHGPWSSI